MKPGAKDEVAPGSAGGGGWVPPPAIFKPVPAFGVEVCAHAGQVLGRGDAVEIVNEDLNAFLQANRVFFSVEDPAVMTKDEIRAWVAERIDAVEHLRASLTDEIHDALSQRIEAFTAKGAEPEALTALREAYQSAAQEVVAGTIDPFIAALAHVVAEDAS